MSEKVIAINRKAHHQYAISDLLEVGIVLLGTEVRSCRCGGVQITQAYVGNSDEGFMLYNMNIPLYSPAHKKENHLPYRPRALLLHKNQQNRWHGIVKEKGLTLLALKAYFDAQGRVKITIGVGKGQKKQDIRQREAQRDWKRKKERLLRHKQ